MLPHIAARVFNTPLMMHPAKAEVIAQALADRFGIASVTQADGRVFALSDFDKEAVRGSGISRIGAIGVIEVQGTLVQRTGSLQPYSGMTGYDGIRKNFEDALGDDSIRAIVLDIDSPGGEVAGCFALAEAIFEARGIKPIVSVLDESAYSAAYAIASAADRIYVPRTGGAGSIGVITMHADMHRAMESAGVDVTVVTHGALKADGNPYGRPGVSTQLRIQADIDALGEMFVEMVARNRALTADAVRGMQAGTFLGAKAVEAGLADEVADPDVAVASILETL